MARPDSVRASVSVPELLRTALDAVQTAGIPFVIARNYEGYPERITGDVDLIVSRHEQPRVVRTLLKAAEACGWLPFLTIRRPYLSYVGLVSRTAVDRGVLVIELFDGGAWAGMKFMSARTVLDGSRIHRSGWRVPRPGHEALLIMGHHLLWNGRVPAKYWDHIRHLTTTDEEAFVQACQAGFGRRLGGMLGSRTEANKLGDLAVLTRRLRGYLLVRAVLNRTFPLRDAGMAMMGRRAVGGGLFLGLVDPRPTEVAQAMRRVADDWHIGSPAARHIHVPSEDIPVEANALVRQARKRGGIMLQISDDEEHLRRIGVDVLAIRHGRNCMIGSEVFDAPAATDVWRALLCTHAVERMSR